MIDLHTTVYNTLTAAVAAPVYYTMFLHSGLETPCISYMEITNITNLQTDITDLDTISFQVDIWGKTISEIQENAVKVDAAMRNINFKRVSSAEMTDGVIIHKAITYECLAHSTI